MAKSRSTLVLAAVAGLAAIGAAGALGARDATARSNDMHCEIQVIRDHGSIVLQPVVSTPQAMSGSYRLQVRKRGGGGGATIDQSGGFTAEPGRPAELGTVSMGGDGGVYEARLSVDVGGRVTVCTERIGGSL